MSIPIDDGTAERIPGDFRRDAKGTPYVASVIKTVRKRNGEPYWDRYARPSSYHHQIEDGYNLQKWDERNIVLGVATDDELREQVRELIGGDIDDPEWRSRADGMVAAAKRAAKSMIAAERGTHTHDITDGTDWLSRAEAGEDLGLPANVQQALVDEWHAMLERTGLEILTTEAKAVHDGYRCAGSIDHHARLTRPLSFVVDGEVITLPAGLVVVLDKKTGKMQLSERDGGIDWWHGYAVQVSIYAGSCAYDVDAEERRDWPWPVSQDWALIAHLPVLDALAGEPKCTLVLVDLAKGRHAADLCKSAKQWHRSRDVFGMPHESIAFSSASPGDVIEVPTIADPRPRLATLTDAERELVRQRWRWSVKGADLPESEWSALVALLDDVARDAGAGFTATEINHKQGDHEWDNRWSQPSTRSATHSPSGTAGGETTPDSSNPTASDCSPGSPVRNTGTSQPPTSSPSSTARSERVAWEPPDNGDVLDEATTDAMKRKMTASLDRGGLPATIQGACRAWAAQASDARRWPPRGCVRWLEVTRAMIAGAFLYDAHGCDDGLLREWLWAITGDEACAQPGVALGVIFGSMSIDTAKRAAEVLDGAADGRHLDYSTGAPRLAA